LPPKGYRHVSLREEVYKKLEEFMREKGLTSINDAVRLLLEYRDIYSKLEYLLQEGVRLTQKWSNVTPARGKTYSKKQGYIPRDGVRLKLVRCRRGVKAPDVYMNKLAERLGKNLIWIEPEEGTVCYAPEEDLKRFAEELNRQSLRPEELPEKSPEAEEARRLGLIYWDPKEEKWEVV